MSKGTSAGIARLVLGFLIAPALVPIVWILFIVATVWLGLTPEADINGGRLSLGLFAVLCVTPRAAYGVTVLVGVPYILCMRSMRLLDFSTVMSPLLALGLVLQVIALVFGLASDTIDGAWFLIYATVPLGIAILVSGLFFYLVGIRRNPFVGRKAAVQPDLLLAAEPAPL